MSARAFLLQPLPLSPEDDAWPSLGMLEFKAAAGLSELNGMMKASARADLFWLTWLLKESQASNIIEGTVTTFDEILGENAGLVVPVERQDDVKEVISYRESMETGLAEIQQGHALTLSFIKALHARLLQGARGERKQPGEWRKIQVHIGMPDSPLEKALYIPPDPAHVSALLENWEAFIHRDDLNPIVQAAIMHAQFEMIHPFCDGNGRMGRLLITLFFAEKGVISLPCFYMSVYLQDHRSEYYSALGNISQNNDWEGWIRFFLNAVIERSMDNIHLLDAMNALYENSKLEFSKATGSYTSIQILDYMFKKPVFTVPDIQSHANIHLSQQGIMNIIIKLNQAGIIEKLAPGKGRKPAVWRFTKLMDLLS